MEWKEKKKIGYFSSFFSRMKSSFIGFFSKSEKKNAIKRKKKQKYEKENKMKERKVSDIKDRNGTVINKSRKTKERTI